MIDEHPLLSPKIAAALTVLGLLWAAGVTLILAGRLSLIGLLMGAAAVTSALWLYWRPLRSVVHTWQWDGPGVPSKTELIIVCLISIFALGISLNLYLWPMKVLQPKIPSTEDIADAVAVKVLSLHQLPTLPDVASILTQPPPQTMYVPVTKYVFRRSIFEPGTPAEAIGRFQIGGTGIGILPSPSASGIGTFATTSSCSNYRASSVLTDESCKPIDFGTSANPLFIQADPGGSDQNATSSNASLVHH